MKIPYFRFSPKLINLLFYTEQSNLGGESVNTGVLSGATSSATDAETQADAPVGAGENNEQVASNGATEHQEAAAPFTIPETDDDLKDVINTPHGQNIAQVRQHARALETDLKTWKSQYEPWKETTEKIGDPIQAAYYHDVFSGLHQPVVDPATGQPAMSNGQPVYSSEAALVRMEQEQPGVVDEIFGDLLRMKVPDETGRPDTLFNHLLRAQGLAPERMDDYRNIDARSSGIVTAEQLATIPPAYHAAYKKLPESLRSAWSQLDDAEKQYHLDTANASIKAAELEDRINRDQQAQFEQQRQQMEVRIVEKQTESLTNVTHTIFDSIQKNLASQITFSEADKSLNDYQLAAVTGLLYAAIDPAAQFIFGPLGINLDAPDAKWHDLIEQFSMKDSEAVRLAEEGQIAQARAIRGQASQLQSRIVAKLNAAGLQLAQRAAGHTVTRSAQQSNGATARTVVNGNGYQPSGSSNPYMDNPYPINSPEYRAFNRDVDKQMYSAANS